MTPLGVIATIAVNRRGVPGAASGFSIGLVKACDPVPGLSPVHTATGALIGGCGS